MFRTTNALTLPVSGTGSAGMEAAFVNLVDPGDVVVVGVNGLFGERMCDVAGRLGAEVVRVEAPWGEPLDPEAVVAAHRAPTVIALVHAETSTGVRNDVEAVARGKGDALLLVDVVTSLGGIAFDVDGWGVDLAYSGTQKCLGVPPGLSPLTVSDRARARLKDRPSSWYFDLGLIARYVDGSGRSHLSPHGAGVDGVRAARRARGPARRRASRHAWARHAACGRALQDGLEKLGLRARGSRRSPSSPAHDGVGSRRPRRHRPKPRSERRCCGRYGIEIGAGVGVMAGRAWRIGCMGHTARMRNVELLLGALGEVLGR